MKGNTRPVVLRCPRIEPHLAHGEVHLPQLERQDLAPRPPPSRVGERRHTAERERQVRLDTLELLPLEESRPDVVLLQHRDVGLREELPGLDGQGIHPFERGQLAVNLPVRGAGRLARRRERAHLDGRDGGHTPVAEERLEMLFDAPPHVRKGPLEGKENMWIKTIPGKGWWSVLRIYGPQAASFDGTWKPGDYVEMQ